MQMEPTSFGEMASPFSGLLLHTIVWQWFSKGYIDYWISGKWIGGVPAKDAEASNHHPKLSSNNLQQQPWRSRVHSPETCWLYVPKEVFVFFTKDDFVTRLRVLHGKETVPLCEKCFATYSGLESSHVRETTSTPYTGSPLPCTQPGNPHGLETQLLYLRWQTFHKEFSWVPRHWPEKATKNLLRRRTGLWSLI